ncbi:MAG: FAD-dependent oxidoreductase [Halohasta sp.]
MNPQHTVSADDSDTSRRYVADGYGRDRQVLVVGEGLVAVSTAGFLAQAGLDPVIASPPDGGPSTEGAICWHSGLVLLERLGLRRPIERLGTRLDRLVPLADDRSSSADTRAPTSNADGTAPGSNPNGTAPASLVAVDRDRLAPLLTDYVADRIRVADRPIAAVEPTATGVRATFDGGPAEPFDAIVTTRRSLLSDREPTPPTGGLHCWEFAWPPSHTQPRAPADAWGPHRAALVVPIGEGFRVRLVAAPDSAPADPLSVGDLAADFGHLFGRHDPFDAVDHGRLAYSRTPRTVPTTLVEDRIARVGPASRAAIPGGCLDLALGIEDGWVLADALAYGPPSVDAALAAYERRRRERSRELTAWLAAAADREESTARSPWLRELYARRRLAFSHVHGGLPAVAEAVPNRL